MQIVNIAAVGVEAGLAAQVAHLHPRHWGILKLLSEEIFDFSRGELTQVRTCAPTCLLPEPLSFLFLGLNHLS